MKSNVCAVIVTYNTDREFIQRIHSLYQQVERIIIVDNGSNQNTREVLKNIKQKFPNVELIENLENVGLASALNQGVREALKNKFEWILTLDDDSEVEPEMVPKMLRVYFSFTSEKKRNIAMLAPNYINIKGPAYHDKKPFEAPGAITSGALIKKDTFQKVGFFRDDFFIYCIDTEFCLRLRKYHLKVIFVPNAFLKHHLGGEKPEIRNFLGKKIIVPNNSAWRYYYVFRNSLLTYADYWRTDFSSVLFSIFSNFHIIAKMLLFEKNRPEKIKMILKGGLDALRGKSGKLQL